MRPLEYVYRQRRHALVRLAMRIVRPPAAADDVVHDVFVSTLALVHSGALDETTTALYPYLRGAIRRWAYAPRFRELVSESTPWLNTVKPSAFVKLAVQEAWEQLTPAERTAVARLHILEDEMCRLDHNVYAARIRIARARLGAA